ncbi:MAG: hypothetical protein ABIF10_07695 [Candidatus Woesearchaeota archaeon]
MNLVHLKEAARIFSRSSASLPKYSGSAKDICNQIVEACFNGRYFQVSKGHFSEFFCRDFSWCVTPLLGLGYRRQVYSTLSYALDCFSHHNKIAVAISPDGVPFDYPTYAVDSLASLLYCLAQAKAQDLAAKHKQLLEYELRLIIKIVLDKKTGLVTSNRYFSSARDHYKRMSSCYDNCMLGMISCSLDRLGFDNPLSKYDYSELLLQNFWTGTGFIDDLSGVKTVTGDANVFPYWSGIITDSGMLRKSIAAIRKQELDSPFPLKYSIDSAGKKFFCDIFTPNYEGSSIWSYLGMLYLGQVGKVNKKLYRQYLRQYTLQIEQHGNFLEVFHPDGRPYSSKFYLCDHSMLWAALYLDLAK